MDKFFSYKLKIEYCGTRYSGWQLQREERTIQGEILNACDKIFPDLKVDIQGGGRTDRGVHALVQSAHLKVRKYIPSKILQIKFNDLLPYDIVIKEINEANPNFHARHDAVMRSYVYIIALRKTAFYKNNVWWLKEKPDIELIKNCSKLFLGTKNFSSFCEQEDKRQDYTTSLQDFSIFEKEFTLIFRLRATHFYWKMVRRIIGTLVQVGWHRLTESEVENLFIKPDKKVAEYTAPPSGLYLENIYYKGDPIIIAPPSFISL